MTFRTREQSRLLMLLAICVLVGCLVWAVVAEASLGDRFAVLGLGCVWGAFLITRLARAGLRATVDEVVIANPLSTRRIGWSQVKCFGIGRLGVYPRVGWVEKTDGSRVRIWGIQGPNPSTRPLAGESERIIDELNQLLAEKKGHAGSVPGQA